MTARSRTWPFRYEASELGGCQGTPAVHSRLLFAINDSNLGDNTYHWSMTIRHYRATPVKTSASAALARCKFGDEGTVTFTDMLWRGAEGGLTLRPGDVYRVTVRGQMRIGCWFWDGTYTADGTGWSDLAPPPRRNLAPARRADIRTARVLERPAQPLLAGCQQPLHPVDRHQPRPGRLHPQRLLPQRQRRPMGHFHPQLPGSMSLRCSTGLSWRASWAAGPGGGDPAG